MGGSTASTHRIFVEPLRLHVEHGLGVDTDTEGILDIVSQPLLVYLLDCSPFLLELVIVDVFEKTLNLVKILKPLGLGNVEGLSDERGEAGVTLIDPAAGGNFESIFLGW